MPIYTYQCETCDNTQEEYREIRDRNEDGVCIECGQPVLKSITAAHIILDGSDPNFVAAHDRWVKHHESKGNGVMSRG